MQAVYGGMDTNSGHVSWFCSDSIAIRLSELSDFGSIEMRCDRNPGTTILPLIQVVINLIQVVVNLIVGN